MNIGDKSEIAKLREQMSGWSEDILEKTRQAISMKRTKKSEREPSFVTKPSQSLREPVMAEIKAQERKWEELSPKQKTDELYKKLIQNNRE